MLYGLVLKRFLPYAVVGAALLGAYFYVRWDAYNDGVSDTTAKYEEAIQKERDRLEAANQAALEEARAREQELRRLLRARDDKIAEISREAATDPNADRIAIGADSVRRLNRISEDQATPTTAPAN